MKVKLIGFMLLPIMAMLEPAYGACDNNDWRALVREGGILYENNEREHANSCFINAQRAADTIAIGDVRQMAKVEIGLNWANGLSILATRTGDNTLVSQAILIVLMDLIWDSIRSQPANFDLLYRLIPIRDFTVGLELLLH